MLFFFSAVLIVLAALAIVYLFGNTRFSGGIQGENSCMFSVIEFSGTEESAEYIIRAAVKRFQWDMDARRFYIIISDAGMSEETLQVCKALEREFDCVAVCKPGEVLKVIESKLYLQTKVV